MSKEYLQAQLEQHSGMTLSLVINDNVETVLNICRARNPIYVSVHRIFLDAPQAILQALARLIRNGSQRIKREVDRFITDRFQKLDYKHKVDTKQLCHFGKFHDLQAHFHHVNTHYFQQDLELFVTWYGKTRVSHGNRVNLGLYNEPKHLVKVHRLLDQEWVPSFMIDFVLYHEMLHHVCPAYVSQKGRTCVHHAAFKERERQFERFEEAERWLQENQHKFFTPAPYRS